MPDLSALSAGVARYAIRPLDRNATGMVTVRMDIHGEDSIVLRSLLGHTMLPEDLLIYLNDLIPCRQLQIRQIASILEVKSFFPRHSKLR